MSHPRRHDAAAERRGPWRGCWEWTGGTNGNGYGIWWENGEKVYVHRAVFEAIYGPPLSNVLHRCDNPPCFNPAHLFDGSLKTNAIDMALKRRQHLQVLSAEQVQNLRRRHAAGGITTRALAAELGVSQTCVWSAITRRSWAHLA